MSEIFKACIKHYPVTPKHYSFFLIFAHTVFCEYFAIWEGQNNQTIRISLFPHFMKLAKARAIYKEEPTDGI